MSEQQPPTESPDAQPTKAAERQSAESRPRPLEDLGDAARDVAQTFRRVNSRLLTGILIAYALATGVTIGAVLTQPVRDWWLFLAMFLVIFAYVTAYIKAHQRQARVLRILSLTMSEALIAFWAFILIDRIPARKVFIDGAVTLREEMGLLWISVGMLALVAVGLLVHWAWAGALQKRVVREPTPTA